ncbi:YdeI/OmpD-associated family protein [Chitinophaga sp. GCM10012297]|uniref:DUF1905 domain-containing protein n=1 Tax=Chitinophaga chungangae TaxID=2821488 RepID=A0ABS3YF33_9BACT|nr:YdeI/OmpD-associated family protein [Chitinophaga chungangae]MBO9153283.1 DUF1905 domain-containing protein [Chitinophaga chungangae]
MIRFTAILKKFGELGEKTGWTYLEIPQELSEKLNPGVKKSYRVKGKLDEHAIEQVALVPMGEGQFIMAVNAVMRKAIGKKQGASVKVQLEKDETGWKLNEDFLACLEDEPQAMRFYTSLAPGHQRYFSNWIDSAKTDETRAKRIAATLNAMLKGMNYGEMIRAMKADKNKF